MAITSATVTSLSVASRSRLALTTEGNGVFGGHLVVAWAALGEVVDAAVAITDDDAADGNGLRRYWRSLASNQLSHETFT